MVQAKEHKPFIDTNNYRPIHDALFQTVGIHAARAIYEDTEPDDLIEAIGAGVIPAIYGLAGQVVAPGFMQGGIQAFATERQASKDGVFSVVAPAFAGLAVDAATIGGIIYAIDNLHLGQNVAPALGVSANLVNVGAFVGLKLVDNFATNVGFNYLNNALNRRFRRKNPVA